MLFSVLYTFMLVPSASFIFGSTIARRSTFISFLNPKHGVHSSVSPSYKAKLREKSSDENGKDRKRIVSSIGKNLRIDRILSNRGLGSRSEVTVFLREGKIKVNGNVVRSASTRIRDTSKITFNDTLVEAFPLLLSYYKPKGVVSTYSDDWGRKHLKDTIPEKYTKHMHPVGRLDADSSGLLLFSSDGTLTHKLLQPKFKVEREYECIVEPAEGVLPPGDTLIKKIQEGVKTADGIFPGKVTGIEGNVIRLIVLEGKYRMVRRMLANAGYPVKELHRFRYGNIHLGNDLKEGEFAPVTGKALSWAQWLRRTPEKLLLEMGPNSNRMITAEENES